MTLRGIEKLHPQNHDLWRAVQRRVADRWSWEKIAAEQGLVGTQAVKELVSWVNDYKEPKVKPMVSVTKLQREAPLRYAANDKRESTVKFLAWRKQREGARAALEAWTNER